MANCAASLSSVEKVAVASDGITMYQTDFKAAKQSQADVRKMHFQHTWVQGLLESCYKSPACEASLPLLPGWLNCSFYSAMTVTVACMCSLLSLSDLVSSPDICLLVIVSHYIAIVPPAQHQC